MRRSRDRSGGSCRGRARRCARDRLVRKRRSWLISTSALRRLSSSLSSHSMAGRSRWLVGSSSSRMSGEGASTRASAARRASPPERWAGSSSPVQAELLQQVARRIAVVAGAKPGLDIGQRRGGSRRNPAPAADSGSWRRAARSGCRDRARSARRRSSAASTCRSRCGRPGRRARTPTPTVRRPTAAACRRRSA